MVEYVNDNEPDKNHEDKVGSNIVSGLFRYSRLITLIALFVTATSVAVAWLLPLTYRAQTILVATINDSRVSGGASLSGNGIGALASRFGLGGVAGTVDAGAEVIATLKSRSFLEQFIEAHDLLPILFSDHWDATHKQWIVDADEIPDISDGVRKFSDDLLEVRTDTQTGLVTVRVDWKDPRLAAYWANDLVTRINALMRAKAIQEAEGSLKYLDEELKKTQPVEIQQSLYGLIETNLNRISLANGRTEYAFRIVDPAVPAKPDEYVSPKRLVITLVGFVFGVFIGLIVAFVANAIADLRNTSSSTSNR